MQNKNKIVKPYLVAFALCLFLILGGLLIYNQLQEKGAPSPEDAWSQLLTAMQDEDIERIRLLTTDRGLASLQFDMDEGEALKRWHGWANKIMEHEAVWLHWDQVNEYSARALCCGANESAFDFVNVSGDWKLDELLPGA